MRLAVHAELAVLLAAGFVGIIFVVRLAGATEPSASRHNAAESVYLAVSPSGAWAAHQDKQSGAATLVRLHSGESRVLKSSWEFAPWVSTPWTNEPERLLLVDRSERSRDALVLLDPHTQRTKRIAQRGGLTGSACISPGSRYVAVEHDEDERITSQLALWDAAGDGRWSIALVPFRFSVEHTAWLSESKALVITGGFDFGSPAFRNEVYLLDVATLRSRPVPFGSGDRLLAAAPYADSTGSVPILVRRDMTTLLTQIDPEKGESMDVGEVPSGNLPWILMWCNSDRIYLWRASGPSETEVMTFRPSLRKLSQATRLPLSGHLSCDRSGRIWGWKAGQITSIPSPDN